MPSVFVTHSVKQPYLIPIFPLKSAKTGRKRRWKLCDESGNVKKGRDIDENEGVEVCYQNDEHAHI